jgi:hypothetical protein
MRHRLFFQRLCVVARLPDRDRADAHADQHPHRDQYPDEYAYRADADAHRDADWNTPAGLNPDRHRDTDSNQHRDGDAYSDSDTPLAPNAVTHGATDVHADRPNTDTKRDSDTNAQPNVYGDPDARTKGLL